MAATDWPRRIDICPWGNWYALNNVSGSSTTRTQNSAYLSGGVFSSGPSSVAGWYVEYKVPLSAGTWALTIIRTTGGNGGQADVTLDGAVVADNLEFYSAGTVNNAVTDTTGIVVSTAGVKTLRFEVVAKHASSGAYGCYVHWVTLRRTA